MGLEIGTTVIVLVEEDNNSSDPPSEPDNEVKSIPHSIYLGGYGNIHAEKGAGSKIPDQESQPDATLDGHPHADGSAASSTVGVVDGHASKYSKPDSLTDSLSETRGSSCSSLVLFSSLNKVFKFYFHFSHAIAHLSCILLFLGTTWQSSNKQISNSHDKSNGAKYI